LPPFGKRKKIDQVLLSFHRTIKNKTPGKRRGYRIFFPTRTYWHLSENNDIPKP